MFPSLLLFEVKDRLWRWSSLVYFIVYFALTFLMSLGFAGTFSSITVNFGLSNKLALNSPIVINYMTTLLGYMGLLVVAPIFGQSINKDFENRFSQILFATPIKKWQYFFSRYIGSLIASVVILSSISFAIWLATLMPFVDSKLIADNQLKFYLWPYLTNLIPNLLIFGAIFIAAISYFKKMAPVYVASIAVFTGWLIAQTLTQDLENKFVAAMIEPFGMEAGSQVVRYWSVVEQNTQTIPMSGILLENRLTWGALGLVFLIFAYIFFDPFRLPKEKRKKSEESAPTLSFKNIEGLISKVSLQTSSWRIFWGLAWSEFKQAFSNIYFVVILLCGILYMFSIAGQVGKMFGTETWPVTYNVLDFVGGSFGLFIVILTTLYAGDLVWKDREQNFYELVDSKPVSNLFLYLSKLASLVLLQVFLSLIILICGVLIQTFKGYTHYELGLYFETLFIYGLPSKILVCVLCLFIQTLSRNKYVGHSIVILYWLGMLWLPSLGFEHRLYLVGALPHATYSDMNHFGTLYKPFIAFTANWAFLYFAMALMTILLWRRGAEAGLKLTWREMHRRLRPVHKALIGGSLAGWVCMSAFIYYNTNILNTYETSSDTEKRAFNYEKTYKQFENWDQPEVISAKVDLDLYPDTQSMHAKGHLIYKNKAANPIPKIFVNLDQHYDFKEVSWSKPAHLTTDDRVLGVKIYDLETPLPPGEEINLDYEVTRISRGFANSDSWKKVVRNGSFIYGNDFSPSVGYDPGTEITENKTRRKYDLPERLRWPKIDDPKFLKRAYVSNDGSWIDFETTVSTSADQTALAPGYLEKDWIENGRHYFHYKMDRPILNFYAYLSARYEVVRDEWNGIKIEVYYQPGHTYDIPRMIQAAKKALEYYTKNFSPFQYRQFRIIEFPRYERFAQSFPNTVPFSESIGFIARVRENDPESIDYPFYVTSHELGHQWWAHQVIGATVQGTTMLSESLAQYSALMVQEKEYGPKQMRKFLKYELDRYLNGRSQETLKELPLDLNENQPYIHYAKGSLVFYALKDFLGEDVVNKVLHDFIRDYGGPEARSLPRSLDLVERFRKVTPPDMKYLIEDLFETITFYDNRTDSVTVVKQGDKFKVTFKGYLKKLRADELGAEKEVPMNDFMDVGLFDKDGNIIYLQKHRFKTGENTLELVVDREPAKGGFDPLNKLIDKVSDDNMIAVTKAP